MFILEIFDPAMCCSTGVCGPSIDPELMRVSTIVNNLHKKGINVLRHNLSQEPQAFIDNSLVSELIMSKGIEALPVTILNDKVVKSGSYPTNQEFSKWLGINQLDLTAIEPKKVGGCCGGKKCC